MEQLLGVVQGHQVVPQRQRHIRAAGQDGAPGGGEVRVDHPLVRSAGLVFLGEHYLRFSISCFLRGDDGAADRNLSAS